VSVVVECDRWNWDIAIGKRLTDYSTCRSLGLGSLLVLGLFQFVSTSLELLLSLLSFGCCMLIFLRRTLSTSLLLEGDVQHTDVAAQVSVASQQ
jgi:hypothetical protein